MSQNKHNFYTSKWVLSLVAILLVVSFLSGCGKKKAAGTGKPADVIATYKDKGKITRGEFDTFINVNKFFNPQIAQYAQDPAFQQNMLKQLITFKILSTRADDKLKAEADKQVADQMQQIQDYFGKQEGGLDKQLKDNKIELKDIEQLMKLSFYTMRGIESKITDQDVKAAYDKKLAADPHVYDIATVSHILIGLKDPATGKDIRTKEEALKKAKDIQDKLNKGADFAALAKENSDDPGSKDNGGTYKDADINQWVPQFKKAAAELPLNTISNPVETDYGYHIMKVEKRSSKTLDDVKKTLQSELAQEKIGEFVEKELPGLIEKNNLPKPEAPKVDDKAPAVPAPSPSAAPAEKK